MTRPSYFYFDLGNVLVFFDHGKCVHNLATLAGVPDARMRHIVFESGLEDRYESGAISSLEFVQAIEHAVQKSLDPTAVLEAAADMFWENESILPVLDQVQRQGIRLGLLSNTCEAHWNWIVQKRYRTVLGWFEHHVLSYEVKSMKPASSIYEEAMRLTGVPANEILFVDDRIDNIEGARAAGWNGIPFVDAAGLLRTMEAW